MSWRREFVRQGKQFMRTAVFVFLSITGMGLATEAVAAIPLITDDTGTQGKGNFQLEILGEYDHDKGEGIRGETEGVTASLLYGILDPVDIVFSVPYAFRREKEGG